MPDEHVPHSFSDRLNPIQTRRYRSADLDAMVRLDEACFDEVFRFSKRDMRHFAETRDALVLVVTCGEELAGFSIVHVEQSRGGPVGYLVTLDVAQEYRRRGLAARLLAEAESEAQRAGCSAMLLHVFTGNLGAIALYEKLGYRFEGTEKSFYGADLNALVYRKLLS